MIQCTWLGLDFSPLILGAPHKTCRSETMLANDIVKVTFANPDNIFSEGEGRSLLSDAAWQGSRIRITRDGETIVDGVVTDGVITRTDCTLDVQSHFTQAFKTHCNTTLYGTNPATAIRELCLRGGLTTKDIDAESFSRCETYLRAERVCIHAVADRQYQTPLLDAINALLEMGNLRAWLDTALHITIVPDAPPYAAHILSRIRASDILGDIHYGTKPTNAVGYSIGHLGDSYGKYPATGGDTHHASEVWTQQYNAMSQWQCVDAASAHAIGRIKLSAARRRRTAEITVRDDGTVPLIIGGIYNIVPWRGNAWLTGYEKEQGVIKLFFEEVLQRV